MLKVKLRGAFIALSALGLLGCVSTNETDTQINPLSSLETSQFCKTKNTTLSMHELISTGADLWSACFEHNEQALQFTLENIQSLLLKKDAANLEHYLYYLRTYSYFGEFDSVAKQTWQLLDKQLSALVKLPEFFETNAFGRRLQEHYAVTLYRYYYQDDLKPAVQPHIETLSKLLMSYSSLDASSLTNPSQYALWELYRSIGFLAYEGRSDDAIKSALQLSTLHDGLINHLKHINENSWPLAHNIWVLAYLQQLQDEDVGKNLDDIVWQQLNQFNFLNELQRKEVFTLNYLVNSFRSKDSCETDFKGQCIIPTIDESLPINHRCSDSLFIRANQMTSEQLVSSCKQLISQEDDFHEKLATFREPVPNDFNQSLRVVIFDNYAQYNRYGQTTFNIQTNNGGMYIEGEPSKPSNQATFFSFEAFWKRPEFSVWNLNHEYVHYLDGRFVKYGGFGHFPSHLVWWSEGLAEYISKRDVNPKAFALLLENAEQDWPGLKEIFATTYSDGTKRVYQWSYLAIRFIYEHYPEKLRQLKTFLKTDYFDGYLSLLDDIAQQHQMEFLTWMKQQQIKAEAEKSEATRAKQPINRTIYRYLYRDYLYPSTLPIGGRHNHNV